MHLSFVHLFVQVVQKIKRYERYKRFDSYCKEIVVVKFTQSITFPITYMFFGPIY